MKVLIVRVSRAVGYAEDKICVSALEANKSVANIDKGIAIFTGIEKGDNDSVLEEIAEKIVNLRIFENEKGKFCYSLKDKNYQVLCIPNFTLCANIKKGRRPSFETAMPKGEAKKLFENFVLLLQARKLNVKTGVFGQHMRINLDFDGPVNIIMESAKNQS